MINDKIMTPPGSPMVAPPEGVMQEQEQDFSQSPQLKGALLQDVKGIETFKNNANIDIKKAKQTRIESSKKMLKVLFDKLKQMGVDPADPQAINAFLEKLEQINPDMRAMFEKNFNGLLQSIEDSKLPAGMGEMPPTPMESPQAMGDMPTQQSAPAGINKYKNLAQ